MRRHLPWVVLSLVLALVAGTVVAADGPYAGEYEGDDGTTLSLRASGQGYEGVLRTGPGSSFEVAARLEGGGLVGTVHAEGETFPFQGRLEGDTLALDFGEGALSLRRKAAASPPGPATPPPPAGGATDGGSPPAPGPARGPGPAPGAPAPPLPAGFERVPHGAPSGEVLRARLAGGEGASALLERALDLLAPSLDRRPRVLGGIRDQADTVAEVLFAGSRQGTEMLGLLFVFRVGGSGSIFVALDRADSSRQAYGALVTALYGCMPADPAPVAWQESRLPDGSGTIRLPQGFQVVGAHQGALDARGQDGEIVMLGTPYHVSSPEWPLESPYRSYLRDPVSALVELAPQNARYARHNDATRPEVVLTQVVESQEIPWEIGKAAFVRAQYTVGGRPYDALHLVAVQPTDEWSGTFYLSFVAAPSETFAERLPALLEVWSSWRIDPKVFKQRWKLAAEAMTKTTEIILDVTTNRAKAALKGNAAWDAYIRDAPVEVRDQNGNVQHIPGSELQGWIDKANQEYGGFPQWQPVKPQGR